MRTWGNTFQLLWAMRLCRPPPTTHRIRGCGVQGLRCPSEHWALGGGWGASTAQRPVSCRRSRTQKRLALHRRRSRLRRLGILGAAPPPLPRIPGRAGRPGRQWQRLMSLAIALHSCGRPRAPVSNGMAGVYASSHTCRPTCQEQKPATLKKKIFKIKKYK